MMNEEEVVANAVHDAMVAQGPDGATIAVQGGRLWVDGEADFDLTTLARAMIAALNKHRAEKAVEGQFDYRMHVQGPARTEQIAAGLPPEPSA